MRVRSETVRTVYFDMPFEEAEMILEGVNQHLEGKVESDYPEDDGIAVMFEFQDKLDRILHGIRSR